MKSNVHPASAAIVMLLFFTFQGLHAFDAVPGSFPLLNTGHQSSVTAVAIQNSGDYGFSADGDGVVKVWDLQEQRLLQQLQVGHDPVIMIASHPELREIALIEEGARGEYRLSVWDWHNQRMSFSRVIEDLPIFLQYSPQGSFLTLALPQWRSLRFYNTQRSQELSYLSNGFGVVDWTYISSGENRLMTYSASNGRIRYVELQSGQISFETQTERNLRHFHLLPNLRHALGYRDGSIFLVDVVNGATLSRVDSADISSFVPVNQSEGTFYAVQSSGGRQRLIPLSIRSSSAGTVLSLDNAEALSQSGRNVLYSSSAGSNRGFFGAETGTTGFINQGTIISLGSNALSPVENIVHGGDFIYLQTRNSISRFHRSLISNPSDASMLSALNNLDEPLVQVLDLPFPSPGGVEKLNNAAMLLWDRNATDGIYQYETFTGSFRSIPIALRAPVKKVRVGDQYVIVFDSADRLYLLDSGSLQEVFSYQSLGLMDAIELENGRILIGKNQSGFFNSSLIEVNPRTGETSIVNSDDAVVFEFAEGNGASFYSLGISTSAGQSYTVIREFAQGRTSSSRTIMRFPGEDTESHMFHNSSDGSLVTSAGLDGVSLYRNRRLQTLDRSPNLARAVYADGTQAFGINIDGSVSVWNTSNRDLSFQIAALPSGEMLILAPGGRFLALESSPGESLIAYSRLLTPVLDRSGNTGLVQLQKPDPEEAGAVPNPRNTGQQQDDQQEVNDTESEPTMTPEVETESENPEEQDGEGPATAEPGSSEADESSDETIPDTEPDNSAAPEVTDPDPDDTGAPASTETSQD